MIGSRRHPGFTLIELLVVVSIITIGLSLVLPAFVRMTESNNYASAVNAVEATLRKAAGSGREGGVVFLYDIHAKQYTLQLVEWVTDDGLVYDPVANQRPNDVAVRGAVFRPVPGEAPVELPNGMGVYGMSFAHDDYGRSPAQNMFGPARWYEGEVVFEINAPPGLPARVERNSWLFPRNHVQFFMDNYDPNTVNSSHPTQFNDSRPNATPRQNPWNYAQTFFVRFTAGGEMVGSSAPGPRDAYLEFDDLPHSVNPSVAPNTPGYVTDRARSFDPFQYELDNSITPPSWVYNPEARLRAVDLLAVVDLNRLAAETGVREPRFVRARVTGPQAPPRPGDKAQWEADPRDQNQPLFKINRWIDEFGEIVGFTRQTGKVVKR